MGLAQIQSRGRSPRDGVVVAADTGGWSMQGPDAQKDNVVSLFSARAAEKKEVVAQEAAGEGTEETKAEKETFDQVMARNHQNRERMRKERELANKSVLRSYRIKH